MIEKVEIYPEKRKDGCWVRNLTFKFPIPTNEGEVKVVHATIKVSMGEIGSATFIDQVLTTNMAQPGDSGSVVVDEYNRVCGLLSAGSQTVSVFARIQNVCEALGVRF